MDVPYNGQPKRPGSPSPPPTPPPALRPASPGVGSDVRGGHPNGAATTLLQLCCPTRCCPQRYQVGSRYFGGNMTWGNTIQVLSTHILDMAASPASRGGAGPSTGGARDDRVVYVYSDKIEVRSQQKHSRDEIGSGDDPDELNDIQIRLKSDRPPSSIGTSSKKTPTDLPPSRQLNATTSSSSPVTSVTTALVTLPSPATVELESRTPSPKAVAGGASTSGGSSKQPIVRISTL
ncbi:Potassium voltage-gated channel protein Shal [Folsomia candida]|uniref:Potassium voltage-gated channel protein Shal n=1 Tax=Folsomia candida TaxID=158441 RepID=A0A226CWH2_FOLCA|nr:Potassium voltage-gated channel protein Shal [Folsomia candida]